MDSALIDYEMENRLDQLERSLSRAKKSESETNENVMYIWEEIRLIKERLDKLEQN